MGNREQMWADGVLDTMYSYASGTNRLDAVVQGMNTTTYGYDQRGFATTVGTKSLVYDQAGRLTRAHEGGSNLGLYRYNGLNQRIRKEAGGVVTYYVYDFDGNLIQEALPDGTIQKEYFYWGDTRLAGIEYRTDPDPDLLFFFHNDRLGTPELITDSTKTVIWEAIYFPFGEAVVNSNSSVVNNFRLPGQYYDAETGLHYNWHRYYDPSTGRYLTPDPIGLAGGINPYVYGFNDPINRVDANGLWTFSIGVNLGVVLGAIGGGGGTAINIGYSESAGVSFSITGTAGGGAATGVGAGLGLTFSATNACSVVDLLGTSIELTRGIGPVAASGIAGDGYEGGALTVGLRAMAIFGPPIGSQGAGTITTTSAIVQWQRNSGLEFLTAGKL